MNRLEITTDSGETWVRPGDTLSGTAGWELDEPPEAIEIRLFWYTSGKGTRDVGAVDQQRIEDPERYGSVAFRFRIPEGPLSFTGTLITLAWAVEAVALPTEDSGRLDLLVGPTPIEIDLRTALER